MSKNEFSCDCKPINQEAVEEVLSQLPEEDVFDKLANFYKIMGDGTRCKLIFALQSREELCVGDLANILGMSKSSISHQLSKMKTSAVVKSRKEGKEVYYSLDDNHIRQIFEITMQHIGHKE